MDTEYLHIININYMLQLPILLFNLTLHLPGGQAGETLEPGCTGQESAFTLRPFIWDVAPRQWVIST